MVVAIAVLESAVIKPPLAYGRISVFGKFGVMRLTQGLRCAGHSNRNRGRHLSTIVNPLNTETTAPGLISTQDIWPEHLHTVTTVFSGEPIVKANLRCTAKSELSA